MQITLKQREIESALKAYIVQQGFSLDGKTVEINFTAGRGTTGLLADMDIENAKSDASIHSDPVIRGAVCADEPEQSGDVEVYDEEPEAETKEATSLFGT